MTSRHGVAGARRNQIANAPQSPANSIANPATAVPYPSQGAPVLLQLCAADLVG